MDMELLNNISNASLAVGKDTKVVSLREQLIEATAFLDVLPDIKIGFRAYCVKNNIYEIPKCPCCGGPNKPNPADNNRGFTKYCSESCSRQSSNLSKEIQEKLSNRDWFYEHRITLRMSREKIAEILGISTQPVSKWEKIHGIERVRYNESDSVTRAKLHDKELLYKLHVEEHKSCGEIADEIGSSAPTVSVHLRKADIPTNKSNSYKRKKDRSSKECLQVVAFIKSIYDGKIETDERRILNGRELDIYLPDKNLAIEYNGVYSHIHRPWESTYAKQKGPTYHITKTTGAKEKGVSLIHIWSSQWILKKDIVKSMIQSKLGLISNTIYARKCEVREIDAWQKNFFLDENHIQGRDRSKYKLGLFYGEELVSVMTFSKSRFNKNYDWELSRFASKRFTNIPGAFSKLLSYFRKKEFGSIITYADLMFSTGEVYSKNGFIHTKTNGPAYWYVKINTGILEHRFKFRKHNITTKDDARTEKEIMASLGYSRIWDCGNMVFVLPAIKP